MTPEEQETTVLKQRYLDAVNKQLDNAMRKWIQDGRKIRDLDAEYGPEEAKRWRRIMGWKS